MYDQFKPKQHQEIYMNQSTLTDAAIYYNNFNYKAAAKAEMSDGIYSTTPNSISCDSQSSSSRLSSPTLGHSVPAGASYGGNYFDDHQQHMDIESSHYQLDFFAKDSFDKIQPDEEMTAIYEQQQQPRVNRGGRKQVKIGTTKRNARERNRVRFINDCFEVLREHIPLELVGDLKNQKLSKVETLKYATIYIQLLGELLENGDGGGEETCSAAGAKVKAESEAPSVKKRAKVDEQPKSSISITNINININEPRISAVTGIVNQQQSVYVASDQYSPCSTSSSSSSSASSTCSNAYQQQHHHQSQQYYHQNFVYQTNQSANYQSYMAPAYAKPAAHDYSQSAYYPNHCSKSFIINSFLNNAQTNRQYSLT